MPWRLDGPVPSGRRPANCTSNGALVELDLPLDVFQPALYQVILRHRAILRHAAALHR